MKFLAITCQTSKFFGKNDAAPVGLGGLVSRGLIQVASANFAHSQSSKGWNVLYSDGSVEFRKAPPQIKLIWALGAGWKTGGRYDISEINQLCNLLE